MRHRSAPRRGNFSHVDVKLLQIEVVPMYTAYTSVVAGAVMGAKLLGGLRCDLRVIVRCTNLDILATCIQGCSQADYTFPCCDSL